MKGPGPHARFRDRAHALRTASLRRWGVLALAVVVLAGAVWTVGFSPVVAVRSIQVIGTSGALADQVRAVADDAVGTPMVRADPAALRARVARLSSVRSVEVTRSLPSTLRVVVRPRVAVVVVERGGTRRLVDAEGVAYAPATEGDKVPVVRLAVGRTSGSYVASAATVMAALPAADRSKASNLQVSRTGQVTFTLDGLAITWGDSTRSPAKAATLRTMRSEAAKGQARTLDLSAPTRPVLG